MAQDHSQCLDAQEEPAADTDRGEELIDMVIAAHGERTATHEASVHVSSEAMQTIVEDERIIFKAKKEIVLQCGDASITLTRTGKIIIRGVYVSSRSTGVNRIQGGSVEIN